MAVLTPDRTEGSPLTQIEYHWDNLGSLVGSSLRFWVPYPAYLWVSVNAPDTAPSNTNLELYLINSDGTASVVETGIALSIASVGELRSLVRDLNERGQLVPKGEYRLQNFSVDQDWTAATIYVIPAS